MGAKGRDITSKIPSIPFSDVDFRRIRQLIKSEVGISLGEQKREMVYGRLSRRIRELGLTDFRHYLRFLEQDDHELIEFVNALTTNLTRFYREPHHFQILRKDLIPELISRNQRTRRIRIWCSAASTGEEPYTIAMALGAELEKYPGWKGEVVATDIDTNVLETARHGVYSLDVAELIPTEQRTRWLRRGKGRNSGWFRVSPELRAMVSFGQTNLLRPWTFKEPFDVIFCRNVLIYFDQPTQSQVVNHFAEYLCKDGFLVVGHSEMLAKVTDRFNLIGKTVYRKAGVSQ